MFTFRPKYFFTAAVIFIIEVLIALYMHDKIIRPYVGDFLVVILIYSFFNTPVVGTAIGVLLFAYLVELLQYLNFIKALGWENWRAANIVLGNYFEWMDMIAYTLGIATVVLYEKLVLKNNS